MLNNFGYQPFRSNQRQPVQRQQPQQNVDELNIDIQNQNKPTNIESRSDDIENINIVKNKLDDRSYFNALFN